MELDPAGVTILAVDDNPDGLFALEQLLLNHGYQVVTASSGRETIDKAQTERPDLILLDVMMPEPNGYEVAHYLKAHPELRYVPIVLLTGRDELKDIIYGLDQGADDYVCKPYDAQELLARVHAALRLKRLYKELFAAKTANQHLRARVGEEFAFEKIIGRSPAMQELFAVMTKVVDSDVPVLVTGESGTGKEVIATAIHAHGPRRDKPFIVQNCSAFNENLLESELFGHVRGAFTGAVRDKEGLFEVANGGTFFLDELGEMSPALQVKLLRVLQDGTFIPVGGTKQKQVDVRIIAATNRNLEEMVAKGTFREDLYYRLNVVNLRLPALRERAGDIPRLAEHILSSIATRSGKPQKVLSPQAMEALEHYSWPGNIRQLENELQRGVVMTGANEVIELTHLSPAVTGVVASVSAASSTSKREGTLRENLDSLEREIIAQALRESGGNKSEAARKLGISRSNLIAKAQSFGLE